MELPHHDNENPQSDSDDKRLKRANADGNIPPGPALRYYQYLWGNYPQMLTKGFLPFVDEMAEQYGEGGVPVRVSLGMKNLYIISDPKDAQLILSGPDKDKFIKGFSSQFLRDYFVGEGVGFLETKGQGWAEVHQAMFSFLKESAVKSKYFSMMQEHAHDLVKRLQDRNGEEIDLEREMTLYTIKMVASAMLNMAVTNDKAIELAQSFDTVMKFIHYRMTNFPFYLPLFLPTAANNNFKQAAKIVDSFLESAIINDINLSAQGHESDSLISYLRKASLSPQPMNQDSPPLQISHARFIGQLRNILMAGHDTTKHLLTSIFYQLLKYPQVKEKLYEELTSVVAQKGGLIEVAQLSKAQLPYLDAVIQEALRVNAPVPAVARDVVHDVNLRGYLIPRGSIVMISFDLLHKNKNEWENPGEFDPDRFLGEARSNGGEKIKRHHNSLMPFSTGQRSCLGKFFALQEVKTTVIELILAGINFDVINETKWTPIMACTRRLLDGFKVKVIAKW